MEMAFWIANTHAQGVFTTIWQSNAVRQLFYNYMLIQATVTNYKLLKVVCPSAACLRWSAKLLSERPQVYKSANAL